jgi:hypothetical protein
MKREAEKAMARQIVICLRADELAGILDMLENGKQSHPVDGPLLAIKIRATMVPK